jgi:hypothetical protein
MLAGTNLRCSYREYDFVLNCVDWQLRRMESRSRRGGSSLRREQGERGTDVTFFLQTDVGTRSAMRLCVCVAVWQRIASGLFGLSVLFKGPICTSGQCPSFECIFVL